YAAQLPSAGRQAADARLAGWKPAAAPPAAMAGLTGPGRPGGAGVRKNAEEGFRDPPLALLSFYTPRHHARAALRGGDAAEAYCWLSLALRAGPLSATKKTETAAVKQALEQQLTGAQKDAVAARVEAWKPQPADESDPMVRTLRQNPAP